MNKKKILVLLSALIVFPLSTIGISASASSIFPGSPYLKVNRVYNNSKSVSGVSSRGTKVYVRLNNKRLLGSTYSSKRNGTFTIKLSKKLAANNSLYVYAQKGRLKPYNVINVQSKVNTKKQTKRAKVNHNRNSVKQTKRAKVNHNRNNVKQTNKHRKNIKRAKVNNIKANNIAGKWNSNWSHGYKQVWTINNSKGFNVSLYKNKHFQKHLIQNAVYDIKPTKKNNLYHFIYRGKNQKHNSYVYLHMTSKRHFNLTNWNLKSTPLSLKGSHSSVDSFQK